MMNFTKVIARLFANRMFVLVCCLFLTAGITEAQNVPASGYNYLAPGTNTTIYDHAGASTNYSANCSGYMILYNSGATSTITLGGSTSGIETCCDYVRIYDGVGTGGTQLAQYTGSSTVNVTSAAGHCLTVYFYSDGSVQGAGFAISVTYTAGTPTGSTLVPTSGNNSVTCGTSTVLYDAAGPVGDYGNSYNGYTVLNNQGSGVITLDINTTGIESCCDYVKVYAGSGTGGTVLGTYTGTTFATLTSSAGQTLTVQFYSDGSVTGMGFCVGVKYSGSCSVPYQSQWISMSVPTSWCAGETKNVTVTVKNNGSATWTDASPDINIGCKWNADADYFVRVNAGGLAPGAQQTYTLTMTAPSTAGSNNLTFDVVNEGNCWFGGNGGSCGPGNVTYVSSAVTIYAYPSAVTVSGGGSVCGSTTLTASGGTPGTIYWQNTTSGGTSTATASSSQLISSNGTYYFRASNNGCWGTQGSAAVTINAVPAAVTVGTSGTYCGSTTLTASGGSGGTIYWQGTTSGGTSTATPATSQTVSSSGTYYFRSRSSAGCWGAQGSATVTITNNGYGEYLCNPIVVGGLCVGGSFSDTRNNGSYANDYGQSSGDIFYRFTLPFAATVNIGHCGSGFDTYIYLLNSDGSLNASNDDYGPVCSGESAASLQVSLAAGTYYVVSEGYGGNTGNITTTISLATTPVNPGTIDAQNQQGLNSWLGQVYDGTAFNTYLGTTTEPAIFDETFGGDYNCFPVSYNNNAGTYSVYTETMSLRYRMVKDFPCGAYTFTVGSDDGIRLWVNGVLVIDQWVDRGYTTNSTSPIYLYGPTSLQLEYYEGGGGNRCSFTYSSSSVNILGSVNVTPPATCGGNGTIAITPSSGSATLWYNNDMNFYGPHRGTSSVSGNASYYYFNYNTPASKDSWLGLTTNNNSQNGSLQITNPYSLNATSFRTEFDLYIGGGSGADGLTFSYGPDVTTGAGANGSGTGLRLVFDTYNNSGSPCQGTQGGNVGVGLYYGGYSAGQNLACTSSALRGAWRHCVFTVNTSGQATLTVDGIGALFSNVSLGSSYTSANKSTWQWIVTASTGGANDYHAIDNLMISAYDQYEYSADGTTWQSSNSFAKPAGSYTLYARNKSGECVSTLGTATIYDPTPPSPPAASPTTVTICSNAATSTISVNTPPANVVTDWYNAPTGGSIISGGTAVNTVTVAPGTYYAEARNTITNCKSTTRTAITLVINAIPAAPTSGGNVTVCNGTSGILTATPPASPSGTSVDWYTGGGTLLANNTNSYTTSTAGTYVAVSQSPAGCSSNPGTSITLTVLNALNYGTVASTGETICNNGDPASFGFSTAPSGATGSFSYQWYYKDGVNTAPIGTTFPNGWNIISGANSNTYDPPAGLTTTRTYACGVDATGSPDCAPMTWAAGQWTVTVRPTAVATISGTTTVCLNSAAQTITFTNSTTLPITVTYNVNSGSNQTINIAGSSTATVSQVATTAGTFTYNLVSAVFQSAPTCVNTLSGSATVTVRPAAAATISGSTTVCLSSAAQTITFTNSTALPITVTYNVNSGTNQTINIAGSSTATVSQVATTAGTFTYNLVSAVFQSAPTCVNTLSGSATVTVRPAAVATISGTTTVCQNDAAPSVTFSNSTALPITVTYNVNSGSNQTINIAGNSTATVSAPTGTAGSFAYNLVSAVFQSAPTCVNTLSGSATVTVRPTPSATISGTTTVCQYDAPQTITFANPMSLPVTVTYNVNSGSNQTINVAANSTATVSQTTTTDGTFTYNLVSVVYQSGPTCSTAASGSATVTVRPTAVATISGTTTVCQNDAAPSVTFSNSTALPITVTYNVNSGSNQTINIAGSSTATVSAPTGTAGSFAYNLVSAVFQSAPACVNTLSGSATVTVRPTPSATISGTTTVCQYDASQTITFANPMSLPVTVTYNVNSGSNQTINVAANSTATVSQATTTDGTFTYNLVSVVYQSGPTCSAAASGSATVTVRPKLDATVSGNATVCQGAAAPNVTFTNPQALPITITYTVNGGSNQTINVPANSLATVAVSTATAGTYVYHVVSGSYQTAPNCPNSIGGTVTVVVQAPVILTATATPNPVCYDATLVLNATVTQGAGITSWSWTGPGGFTASTQNTSRSNMLPDASHEGVYYVSATNICGASTPQPTAAVTVNPELTANVVIDECVSVGPDNYYMLVTAAGGVPGYTFTSPKFLAGSDKAVYEVAAGNTDFFTITDASNCTITTSGTAPTGHPTDIVFSNTTGTKSVDCYDVNMNNWLTFRDDATNEAILSINDNGKNLGQVTVTVYKEAVEPATYTTGNNCLDFTDFKAMQRHFMVTTANAPNGPVGVRLYFTQDEANALHAASIGNNVPGNSCTENDDFNDVTGLTDLYVTKYTGADEDDDYTNNHANGLYRVFGTANGLNTPDGPLTKGAAQFGNLFNGAQSHHYVELTVTEFSEFWMSGSYHASALPVEMIYLEANAIDNSYIQLTWATAIEINNKGFQVERSLDGQTWSTIGWVDGHDNSTVQQNYSYNDMDVTGNVRYYYRLKQIDFDGAFEYTDLVSAIITQQSTFNVKDFVPNPTLNNTNLIVTSSVDQDIDVAFYNLLGEVVSSSTHSLHKGGNQINFSLSTLAAGTYTAVVTSKNEVYSKKIVVVK